MITWPRALWLAVLCCLVPGRAAGSRSHPPLLQGASGCELWQGQAKGNDAAVRLSVRLCQGKAGVTGQVQWSSLRSGWNLRQVAGAYDKQGKQLRLRDLRILKQRPKPGWRFCVIDRYQLRRVGQDLLQGGYWSSACDDRAEVVLRLVKAEDDGQQARPAAPDVSTPAPTPPAPAPSTPAPRPDNPDRATAAPSRGCGGCALDPASDGTSGWPLLALLALVRRWWNR